MGTKRKELSASQRDFLKDQPNQLLGLNETIAILRIPKSTFYAKHPLAKRKVKVGRGSYWSREVVLNWIKEQFDSAVDAA